MTRIDFYLLSAAGGGAVPAACRLCEKAVAAGHRLYILTGNGTTPEAVDGALWSFRQGSFVAHEMYPGTAPEHPAQPPLPPILIGTQAPPDSHRDILVNLGSEVPDWFSSFERVLEVVPEDPALRAQSRERYRYYRERGYALNTFEQTADGAWQRKAPG